MSWQEFTIGMVDALAWPLAVVIVSWLARGVLGALHDRIRHDLESGNAMKLTGPGGVRLELERSDSEGLWFDLQDDGVTEASSALDRDVFDFDDVDGVWLGDHDISEEVEVREAELGEVAVRRRWWWPF